MPYPVKLRRGQAVIKGEIIIKHFDRRVFPL